MVIFGAGFYIYTNFTQNESLWSDEITITNDSIPFYPTSTSGQIIHHKFFSLSYSEKHEQSEWVAYHLKDNHIVNTKFNRPYFNKDSKIKSRSAHYKNYSKSGYDKGHLCPAADRKFSKDAHDETFIMSNVSPQLHSFNSGIWNRLEQKTRYWATKYKGLYIVTGGVLKPNLKTIGTEKVTVPKSFYKIILDYTKPEVKAIAFLIPHQDSDKALYHFVTSIDKIEDLTSIDFFPNLPDEIEDKLEASSNYKNWIF